MGTPSQYYVDPSIDADSGTGTVGDPYGDLQYALNQVSRDSADGDQFNIKAAGTDELLTASLDLSSYGTPTITGRLIFRGYTSTANDGGVGGISGNGSVSIFTSSTIDAISWIDLHLHNTGSNVIVDMDRHCTCKNVQFSNTSGNGLEAGIYAAVDNCNFHDIGGDGAVVGTNSSVRCSYFANGTKSFSDAVFISSGTVSRCQFSLSGSSTAIRTNGTSLNIEHNSILSSSGTGKGIDCEGAPNTIVFNLIEGFSGTGGVGISYDTNDDPAILEGNALYNNATNYDTLTDGYAYEDDNETLSASPFSKSGDDTFANRLTYFAPADTGNVIGGGFSNLDKGSVQSASSGGSSTTILSGFGNGGFAS